METANQGRGHNDKRQRGEEEETERGEFGEGGRKMYQRAGRKKCLKTLGTRFEVCIFHSLSAFLVLAMLLASHEAARAKLLSKPNTAAFISPPSIAAFLPVPI